MRGHANEDRNRQAFLGRAPSRKLRRQIRRGSERDAVIQIRTLDRLVPEDLPRIVTGYVAHARYVVERSEDRDRIAFTLRRVELDRPFVKEFAFPSEDIRKYAECVRQGWSLGAFEGDVGIGIALAERRDWNRSLWVWGLGVAEDHRRRGIGRGLVEELSSRGRKAGLRVLVCETQSTNVPAIDFYRSTGFVADGVDLSYYSNEDAENGEVALFMKKRL